MSPEHFAAIALSLPGATEGSHFGKRDFRGPWGKIFATLPGGDVAVVNLTRDQQAMMVEMHAQVRPVPNGWGLKGWTEIALADCPEDTARHILDVAYANLAAAGSRGR